MAGNAPHIPGCRDLSLIGERVARSLFSATSDRVGRPVTVTVFPPLSEGRTREQFDRAAATAQRLGAHPSVVTIHEWGHAPDGRPWVVTDPQPPESVDTLLTMDGPLEVERAMQVGVLLAGALETAHRAGIVHGDLSPARLVFGTHGEPLLAETGLAAFAVFPGLGALNNPVRYYAPPEVLERTEVSPATDVFSLATTVYALLAGRAPQQKPAELTDSNASLLLRILQMPVPPIERAGLPPGLEEALRGPLSPSPHKRPQQAIEMAWLLQDAQRRAGLAITEPVVLDLDGTDVEGSARRPPPPPAPPWAQSAGPVGSTARAEPRTPAPESPAAAPALSPWAPPPAPAPAAPFAASALPGALGPPAPPLPTPPLPTSSAPPAPPLPASPALPAPPLPTSPALPAPPLPTPPALPAPPQPTSPLPTPRLPAPPLPTPPTFRPVAARSGPGAGTASTAAGPSSEPEDEVLPADFFSFTEPDVPPATVFPFSDDPDALGLPATVEPAAREVWTPPGDADEPGGRAEPELWPAATPDAAPAGTLWPSTWPADTAPPGVDAAATAWPQAQPLGTTESPGQDSSSPADVPWPQGTSLDTTTDTPWPADTTPGTTTDTPWSDHTAGRTAGESWPDAAADEPSPSVPWAEPPVGPAATDPPRRDEPADDQPPADTPWPAEPPTGSPPTTTWTGAPAAEAPAAALWPSTWPADAEPPTPALPPWAATPPPQDEPPVAAAASGDDGGSIGDAPPLTSSNGAGDGAGPPPLFPAISRPPELDELPAWYTDPLPNAGNRPGAGIPDGGRAGADGRGSNGHTPGTNGASPKGTGAPAPGAASGNGHGGNGQAGLPGAGDELRSLFGEVVRDPDGGPPARPPAPPGHAPPVAPDADPLGPPNARPPIDLSQLDTPLGPAPYLGSSEPPAPAASGASPASPTRLPRRHEVESWPASGTGRPGAAAAAARQAPRLPRAGEPRHDAGGEATGGPRLPRGDGQAPRPTAAAGPPALPLIILIAVVAVLVAGVAWLVLTGDEAAPPASERPAGAETESSAATTTGSGSEADGGAGVATAPAPTGLQVGQDEDGVQVTWSGAADGSYVVTVLTADLAPKTLPATAGTTVLVPTADLGALDQWCITVAVATDGGTGAASEPACAPGTSLEAMRGA